MTKTNPQDSEKPDGWIVTYDRKKYTLLPDRVVYEKKSVAETAMHMEVHMNERRFYGIFHDCEEELKKLGWRIRPVKLVFLDEDK